MPPANTPQNPSPENSRPTTGYRPLTPSSYLTSPVTDLASTLVSPREAGAHDENVRFIRESARRVDDTSPDDTLRNNTSNTTATQRRPDRRPSPQQSTRNRPNFVGNAESQIRHEYRDRLLRAVSRPMSVDANGGPHQRQRTSANSPGATQDVGPSTTQESRSGQDLFDEIADLREMIEDLRQENPYADPEFASAMSRVRHALGNPPDGGSGRPEPHTHQSSSDILSSLQRTESHVQALQARLSRRRISEQAGDYRPRGQRSLPYGWRDDRPQISPYMTMPVEAGVGQQSRTRNRFQQEMRQGTSSTGDQDHEQTSSSSRSGEFTRDDVPHEISEDAAMQLAMMERLNRDREHRAREQRDQHETLLSQVQRPHKPSHLLVTPFLENAVKYLDRIRDCTSYDGALAAAIDNGFANKEFFADKHDDFLMEVKRCRPPVDSTWLRPGARFTGSQYTSPHSPGSARNGTLNFDATRPISSVNTTFSDSGLRASNNIVDHWPVKVMIHAVDFESMTLSGTMEAYDVPLHGEDRSMRPALADRTKVPPITTFLEGQIIDLQKHSLLTPATQRHAQHNPYLAVQSTSKLNFPTTNAASDAANWRRLPPFGDIKDDDEVARILLSHDRMAALNEEYIFMRWKERCFIHRDGDKCPASPHSRRVSVGHQTQAPSSGVGTSSSRSSRNNRSAGRQGRHHLRTSQTQHHDSSRSAADDTTPAPTRNAPDSTALRLSATPGPPSSNPGPGPSIIAHIPSTNSISYADPPTSARTTSQAYQQPQPFRMPRTITTPSGAQAVVLGEGDDTDTGHGLTIGGFYYVSLNRLSGQLVGLYFDTGTTPYQCLRLSGVGGGGVGGWKFA